MSRAEISVIPKTRPVNSRIKLQLRWLRIQRRHKGCLALLPLQSILLLRKSPSKHSSLCACRYPAELTIKSMTDLMYGSVSK